jgi:hypothetical protein
VLLSNVADRDVGAVDAAAVREFVDAHRDEINAGLKAVLARLTGTYAAALSRMTGLSADDLDGLGGVPT